MTGIERLRELIDENGPGRYIVVPAVGGTYQGGYIAATMDICNKLADIADQIERETDKVARADWQAVRDVAYDMADRVFMSATIDELLREWSRKLNDATDGHVHPAADVSMSAYDLLPQEDRDAIAWVREHGGLDAVKRRWECLSYYADPVPRSYAERRIAARQRQIDESHAALRRRNELIAELNARVENQRAALDGLVKSIDEMRPRLMPEGMDWPRFEDGEPVRIGDVAADKDGDGFDVWSIEFDGEMVNLAGEHRRELFLMPGVRVKRPTPKVLDADGAEIELGDDLYIVEGSLKLHVSHVDRINGMIATDAMFSLDKWADPAMYTHRAPVLAARGGDGVGQ